MKIYLAGVSRVVRLEKFLVKINAGRLLSFYYENDNKKTTKAFRVWEMMKLNPGKKGEALVRKAWPEDADNPNKPNNTYADKDKKTVSMGVFDIVEPKPRAVLKKEPEVVKTVATNRSSFLLQRSKQIYDVIEEETGLEEFPEEPPITEEDPVLEEPEDGDE